MNLRNIILGQISQSQKRSVAWFHLYEVLRKVKITETEIRGKRGQRLRERRMELILFHRYKVSVLHHEERSDCVTVMVV
jgi:hypothetical protein